MVVARQHIYKGTPASGGIAGGGLSVHKRKGGQFFNRLYCGRGKGTPASGGIAGGGLSVHKSGKGGQFFNRLY